MINHVIRVAIIFSHSAGCLFTLLIVSFDVQKLLSLIRSHLFIFAFISNILGQTHAPCIGVWSFLTTGPLGKTHELTLMSKLMNFA